MTQSPPPIVGVHSFRFPVGDVVEARDWWVEVLGFRCALDYEEEDGIVGALLTHPSGISISLHLVRGYQWRSDGFAGVSLTVGGAVEIQRWIGWLDQQGVDHTLLSSGHLGSYVDVQGPAGIYVRLHSDDPYDADET